MRPVSQRHAASIAAPASSGSRRRATRGDVSAEVSGGRYEPAAPPLGPRTSSTRRDCLYSGRPRSSRRFGATDSESAPVGRPSGAAGVGGGDGRPRPRRASFGCGAVLTAAHAGPGSILPPTLSIDARSGSVADRPVQSASAGQLAGRGAVRGLSGERLCSAEAGRPRRQLTEMSPGNV